MAEKTWFGGVLLLAALLRFTGLHWGIPTPEIPHPPFHMDEKWVIDVLAQMDIERLQLNPYQGHREGTLLYYLLTGLGLALRGLGLMHALPDKLPPFGADYATFLYAGRSLVVILDLLTVVLVYAVVKRTTKNAVSALLAAAILAITPFEVVHAHFLRTHIPSNFFIALVLFLSTSLYERSDAALCRSIGFACGLATACRYPSAIVVSVPLAILLSMRWCQAGVTTIGARVSAVARDSAVHRVLLFMVLGFLIADPYLFLDPGGARTHLAYQRSFIAKGQFSGAGLLDLSRVWVLLSDLIPHGSFPWLWVLFYASMLYVLFRVRRHPFSGPLVIFLFAYLVPMAKGYTAQAVWVRLASAAFPVFAILTGTMLGDVWERVRGSRAALPAFAVATSLMCLPSLAFALAYVTSMARDDARLQLYRFLTRPDEKLTLRIGYYSDSGNFLLYSPTLDVLRERVTQVELGELDAGRAELDYVLLGKIQPSDDERFEARLALLRAGGRFELVRVFANPISIGGLQFPYEDHPHDMRYPFPLIHLLKARPRENQ